MGHTQRRHYRTRFVCPECGCDEILRAQDASGTEHMACSECFVRDGVVVEPVLQLLSLSETPTRTMRLAGVTPRHDAPLSKTARSRSSPVRKTRAR